MTVYRLLVVALTSFALLNAQEDLIVKTSFGSIQGYEVDSFTGTRVKVFKSLPFASPPTGDLRWKLPEKPKNWGGVLDGTKYSAACMSNSTTTSSPQKWVSEDCLYINIFAHGECTKSNKCPVIVYYHGGAMNYDSATYFNDSAIIETYAAKGVVLVIPAFRLGFTGQFSLTDNGELIPYNLGFHDALYGLKFISDEIGAFGGDKDDITLMGHSFGGGMSILLGFSPARKLLVPIKKIIAMSPGLFFDFPETNERLSTTMIMKANCSHTSKRVTLACMKSKTGEELLAIQREMEEDKATWKGLIFGGIVMKPPLFPFSSIPEMMKSPPKVDVMMGSTIAEMDFPPNEFTPKGIFNGAYMGLKNLIELDNLYYNLTESGKNNETHLAESQQVYVGVYVTARAIMEKGRKAFVYSFDQPTHHMHTDDLSYLMGIHWFAKDENEEEIARFYPQLFLNFTKTGVPSPEWKPMKPIKENYYSIAVNKSTGRIPENRNFYEKETIDFWVRKAPAIDKMITVSKAAGAKLTFDKVKGGLRDLEIEDDNIERKSNETMIPVILIHSSYFPSIFFICAVFLLGMILGRYFLDSSSSEERMWILGPDGRGVRIDPNDVPVYAEKMF